MPELKRLIMTRIVSTKEVLDTAVWPQDRRVIRIAIDELLLYPALEDASVDDPHAIIISDGSFASMAMDEDEALAFLSHSCEWELPTKRPAFAQGAVGGIATKLLFEEDKIFFIIPAAMIAEFQERLH